MTVTALVSGLIPVAHLATVTPGHRSYALVTRLCDDGAHGPTPWSLETLPVHTPEELEQITQTPQMCATCRRRWLTLTPVSDTTDELGTPSMLDLLDGGWS